MWDLIVSVPDHQYLIVSVPDHCLSFYFSSSAKTVRTNTEKFSLQTSPVI